MKKKKCLIVSFVIIFFICITVFFIVSNFNRSNRTTPIDYLVNSINTQNENDIPKAFHEYCSLCIEQNISKENFDEYISGLIKDFGSDYKLTYKVINSEKLSDEETESYEYNAFITYSNYPFFSNGEKVKFDSIEKIAVNMTIKGNKQEQNGNITFLIVKIDGKFYFLHTPNQLMSMFINY